MPLQLFALLISLIALCVSVMSFLFSRQAAWSIRYYERWFQLARIVLDRADLLLPLWCNNPQYQRLYAKKIPPDRDIRAEELVFTEMYVDFLVEVNRRGSLARFLTGKFPGQVPLTNPRMLRIWETHVSSLYPEKVRRIVERAIAKSV